jgi:hypothetical protein
MSPGLFVSIGMEAPGFIISLICDPVRLRPGREQQGYRDGLDESIIFSAIVTWLEMVYIQIL